MGCICAVPTDYYENVDNCKKVLHNKFNPTCYKTVTIYKVRNIRHMDGNEKRYNMLIEYNDKVYTYKRSDTYLHYINFGYDSITHYTLCDHGSAINNLLLLHNSRGTVLFRTVL